MLFIASRIVELSCLVPTDWWLHKTEQNNIHIRCAVKYTLKKNSLPRKERSQTFKTGEYKEHKWSWSSESFKEFSQIHASWQLIPWTANQTTLSSTHAKAGRYLISKAITKLSSTWFPWYKKDFICSTNWRNSTWHGLYVQQFLSWWKWTE